MPTVSQYKICPRCKTRTALIAPKCDVCGRIFQTLVVAPEEKTQFVRDAAYLPTRNEYAPAQRNSPPRWFYGVAFALAAIIFLCFIASLTPDKPGERMAFYQAQDFVKVQLVAPATADFPAYSAPGAANILEVEPGVFTVRSYVDSQNRFGANIRTHYTCRLRYLGARHWICEGISNENEF